MILRCSFEELKALRDGARAFLKGDEGGRVQVVAPPAEKVAVEELLPRLEGDLSISTLHDQRRMARAIGAVVASLRLRMESRILATHAGDEHAVSAYFEFGHSLAVLGRVEEMGMEMEALIELVTGAPATDEIARTFKFPD